VRRGSQRECSVSEHPTNSLMTCEELLNLPDEDGIERWLIDGELRERSVPWHSPGHGVAVAGLCYVLGSWARSQPKPRGKVYGYGAPNRLRRGPDTMLFPDASFAAVELESRTPPGAAFLDGPPVLAVEVPDFEDRCGDVSEKIQEYLGNGVDAVWVVDPWFDTVTVFRPRSKPELFTADQELTAEAYLPGLCFTVSELFGD